MGSAFGVSEADVESETEMLAESEAEVEGFTVEQEQKKNAETRISGNVFLSFI